MVRFSKMETEDYEWELSKENVQPLRKGRDMSALSVALHSDQGQGDEIKRQQSNFEMELRTCESDDEELNVYERYIKWIEQYYPKGGHDGKLLQLVEKCLHRFNGNDLYKEDPRFINICIKFANMTEPLEVYKYMFDNGMGTTVAAMYVDWAINLEKMGETKRAHTVYTEGLNRMAQPKDLLVQMRTQFEMRLAQNIRLQVSESQHNAHEADMAEKRMALSRLKTRGTLSKVGVNRTGHAKTGSAGTLKVGHHEAPKQITGKKGFQIFCDENQPPSDQLQQTHEWQSIPTRAVDNLENERAPGKWAGVKVKPRPGSVTSSSLPFEIHEDQKSSPPRQACTTMMGHQPLSSQKAPVKADALSSLRQPLFQPNTGIPMYQKDKIYNGLIELSFEQLRANRYWKMRRQREEKQKQDQQLTLMQQQMEKQNAQIALLQAELMKANIKTKAEGPQDQNVALGGFSLGNAPNILREVQVFNDGAASFQFEQPYASQPLSTGITAIPMQVSGPLKHSTPTEEGCGVNVRAFERQPLQCVKPASTETTPSSDAGSINVSSISGSERGSVTGSGGAGSTSSSSSSVLWPSMQQQQPQCVATPSSASKTPEHMRRKLTAPSPTVHTKEAYNDICGMFQDTLSADTSDLGLSNSKTPSKLLEVVPGPYSRRSAHKPFEIYEEFPPQMLDEKSASKPAFQIYDENALNPSAQKSARKPFQIYEEVPCEAPASKVKAQPFQIFDEVAPEPSAQKIKAQPFQIFEEVPSEATGSKVKSQPFQIYEEGMQTESPVAPKPGFFIHEDAAPTTGPAPMSGVKEAPQTGQYYRTYTGVLQDEKTSSTAGKSSRRLLNFTDGDVDMTEVGHIPPEFTIEYDAPHDQTVADLKDFSHHARATSTPFYSTGVSRIALEHQQPSQETSAVLGASTNTTNNATNVTGSQISSFGISETAYNKDLSPIFEGSNEASDESEALHNTGANATQRTRHNQSSNQRSQVVVETRQRENHHAPIEQLQDFDVASDKDLDRSCQHIIDTSVYVTDPRHEKQEAAQLEASIFIDPHNPFDENTIALFLANMEPLILGLPNFIQLNRRLPCLGPDSPFVDFLSCNELIGEGGNAKIWKVTDLNDEDTLDLTNITSSEKAIKVQKSGGKWEFYISHTLQQRLSMLNSPVDMSYAVLGIDKGYFFEDGCALEMELLSNGTLLNIVNKYRGDKRLTDTVEAFACLVTIELLRLFEAIHACDIIHGDVKPDNFLMMALPILPKKDNLWDIFKSPLQLFKLIDFGQSIDMTKFPEGTTFTAKVLTSGFQCIEMKTNRPWTYQTDLFGLAGTVHVILFGSYMKVFQEHGVWKTTGNFVRKWNVPLWKNLFKELLNIPSCDQQPNLAQLRAQFEEHFVSNLYKDYNPWARRLKLNLAE